MNERKLREGYVRVLLGEYVSEVQKNLNIISENRGAGTPLEIVLRLSDGAWWPWNLAPTECFEQVFDALGHEKMPTRSEWERTALTVGQLICAEKPAAERPNPFFVGRCATCKWWTSVYCFRNAPVSCDGIGRWPTTRDIDFCGDHEPRRDGGDNP